MNHHIKSSMEKASGKISATYKSDLSAVFEAIEILRYWEVITGFDKPDSVDVISMYPNMGTLSEMFLRDPLIDTSFGKQQDLAIPEISVYLG